MLLRKVTVLRAHLAVLREAEEVVEVEVSLDGYLGEAGQLLSPRLLVTRDRVRKTLRQKEEGIEATKQAHRKIRVRAKFPCCKIGSR